MQKMNAFEQGLLTYFSAQELEIIQEQQIGIGGAGGLGSNSAIMLARSGFKYFKIIDFDVIEPSNLNRQQYILQQIGKKKVTCLAEYLTKINPDISCKTFATTWVPDEQNDPLLGCNVIVEAFDKAAAKAEFVRFYSPRAEYVISGNGLAGNNPSQHLPVQKIGNIFIVGDQKTEAGKAFPPLAPRVIACASKMCEIILELALNGSLQGGRGVF
ncbi:MAG TPA: sulfur carrier protein ThiS adenylyltransferase ThiF [Candidatus Omnitrophota bacterium]|nr:sulfur carrier protein ThiS adenylyltransferase ThiF [Candidatus Omnitrophota bacterium]HSA30986.1 sulfur carrier protein ThiS adenylyltransferase ThiF [Candidatus Omnitrophota bacterium]